MGLRGQELFPGPSGPPRRGMIGSAGAVRLSGGSCGGHQSGQRRAEDDHTRRCHDAQEVVDAETCHRPRARRRCRSAAARLGSRLVLLLQANPVGRLDATRRQLAGTSVGVGEDRVDQPRDVTSHRQLSAARRSPPRPDRGPWGRDRGRVTSAPSGRGAVLRRQCPERSGTASGSGGPQLGTGGCESLGSFGQPRSRFHTRPPAPSSTSNSPPSRSTQCRACARASSSWRRR